VMGVVERPLILLQGRGAAMASAPDAISTSEDKAKKCGSGLDNL
jgi:hypothetical protein